MSNRRNVPPRSEHGAALVVTLIVLVVLAAIAVAFMQNTGLDRAGSRSAANVYRARLAAEAGLAEAMGLIQQNVNNFAYVTGSRPAGDGYRTFIRRLKTSGGSWQFDGDAVNLDSGAGEDVGLVLTGTLSDPGLEQRVAWKPLDGAPGGSGPFSRYGFWVDEGGAKQNLTWWGGAPAPAEGSSLTNLAQLTPFLPDESGGSASAFPESALQSILEERTLSRTNFTLGGTKFDSFRPQSAFPTVATVNLVDDEIGGRVNSYFFTLSSASGAVTPKGTPKLNLAALAKHVNGLNTDQGADSPKALLVADLLKEKPDNAASWGGGSFYWLVESGKYSEDERKQIVANIIDYLDEDLIPTTDSTDTPTFFGVEFKLNEDGEVRGHPFVNMIGFGSVYNWSGDGDSTGALNSTLLLLFCGIVNPWSSTIELGDYALEVELGVEGAVEGGTLGVDAANYFRLNFEFPGPEANPELAGELEARSGTTLPGPAQGNNYAARYNMREEAERQPKEIVFNNIVYKPDKFRIRFTDSNGREGFVYVAPSASSVTMDPATVTSPGVRKSDVYKFTRLSPNQKDLHLAGDPRASFKESAWEESASSGGATEDIPAPQTAVDITADVGENWDGAQGMQTDSSWYKSTSVTNHFNRGSESGMSSIGELGYIWTGKPWQTLNLIKTDNPLTADWNLLDYVSAGRFAAADGKDAEDGGGTAVSTLPLAAPFGTNNIPLNGGLLAQGGFNVNTRKRATVEAVLAGQPGIPGNAADAVVAADSGAQASAYGEIAALAPELVEGGDYKFQREAAQRALANVAVNHSRVFTVYSVGEYRQGNSASRAQLEADIFVGIDPQTGQPLVQIINQRFL